MRAHDLLAYLEMLEDRVRLDAYEQAINRLCPGKVVIDLGCGMGILSHLALKAGAERVYGIEVDRDVLMIAYRLAQQMDRGTRFVPLLGPSSTVNLPLAADVLVSETFDSFGIGEGGVGFMLDAVQRLCKPSAVVIPERLRAWLGLGTSTDLTAIRERLVRSGGSYGLDYSRLSELLPTIGMALEGDQSLTDLGAWFDVKLGREDFPRESTIRLRAWAKGTIDAILGHFELGFDDGRSLSTCRVRPMTHWRRGVMPLPVRLLVEPSQELDFSLSFGQPDARGTSAFKYQIARC